MANDFEDTLSASDLRIKSSEIIMGAEHYDNRYLITRSGKSVAVLIGYKDYCFLRKLEDEFDRNSIPEVNIEGKKLHKIKKGQQRRLRHADGLEPPSGTSS